MGRKGNFFESCFTALQGPRDRCPDSMGLQWHAVSNKQVIRAQSKRQDCHIFISPKSYTKVHMWSQVNVVNNVFSQYQLLNLVKTLQGRKKRRMEISSHPELKLCHGTPPFHRRTSHYCWTVEPGAVKHQQAVGQRHCSRWGTARWGTCRSNKQTLSKSSWILKQAYWVPTQALWVTSGRKKSGDNEIISYHLFSFHRADYKGITVTP